MSLTLASVKYLAAPFRGGYSQRYEYNRHTGKSPEKEAKCA
jgi:hypothetical protein